MPKVLEKLMIEAKEALSELKDNRKPSRATKYKMEGAGIGALSVIFCARQKQMQIKLRLKYNLEKLALKMLQKTLR